MDVVCGLIYQDAAILAAQRAEGRALEGLWEFPGGKVERHESPAEALQRELAEELGIRVRILKQLPNVLHPDSSQPIRLIPFLCQVADRAVPEAREHAALDWVDAEGAAALDWAPADRPLVASLRALLREAATLSAQLHSG